MAAREGFTNVEKNGMLPSQETFEGLRMTSMYKYIICPFMHALQIATILFLQPTLSLSCMVEYVFKIPDVKVFFSMRVCQDPLEKFFGCQRHK